MKYELAKKLKDAGFPYDWSRMEDHDPELLVKTWYMYGKGYSPTLEELIEACGKNINFYLKENWSDIEFLNWEAFGGAKTGNGKTPTEAVANLWLELNKK